MKLVTYSHHGPARLGALISQGSQEYVLDLAAGILEFLDAGESALDRARSAVALAPEGDLLPQAQVTLLAPIPRPGKIICLGHNYQGHIGLGKTSPDPYPTFFCKTSNTVVGPGQPIVIPAFTQQVDYEAELAVVIGKRARHVPEERALEYVAGYTIFNDVSARDYQKRTSQWMIGKSFDTFGPMGPALVTADEIPDPHHLELSLALNGLEMQHANTCDLIFSIPYLIAYLTAVMTLDPGDVISTGTPAKTEQARSLPPFIKPGDEIKIRIESLGELVTPVVAKAGL